MPLSEQPKGFQSEKKEWPGVLKVGTLLIEACLKQILSHLFIYLVIIQFRFCLVGVYILINKFSTTLQYDNHMLTTLCVVTEMKEAYLN